MIADRSSHAGNPRPRLPQEGQAYRQLVEQLPLVTYIDALDDVSSNLYTSPQVEELLGYPVEEWLSNRELFVELLHPDDRERVLDEIHRANEDGVSRASEYRLIARDGRVVWLRDESVTVRDEHGAALYAQGFLLDITERKAVEETLRGRERILGAVATVAEQLLREASWEEAVEASLRALGQATEADRVLLFRNRLTPAGELRIGVRHEWAAASVAPLADDPELRDTSLPAYGLSGWIPELAAGRAVQGPVSGLPDPARDVLARRGVGSLVVVPVFVGGAWWGFLLIEDGREQRIWEPAEVEALRAAAGIVGAAIQRRLSEERSRETAGQLQAVVQASPAAIVGFDREGRVILWNPAAERTFGWAAAEALGAFNPLVSEAQREEFLGYVGIALGGKGWRDVEIVRQRKDGSEIDVSVSSAPLKDGRGQAIGLVSVLADITERKRAEAAALEREERFRTLIENIPGAVYRCVVDEGWTMEFLSDDIEGITGYPASDFLGNEARTYASVIHPDDRDRVDEAIAEAVARRSDFVVEYRLVAADSSTRWAHEKGQPVFGEGGDLLWLDGVIIDVTERKEVEEELSRAKALLDSVVESIPVGLYVKDASDLTYVRVNPAAEQILGFREEELRGRRSLDVFPPELAQPFEDWDREVLAGRSRVDAPEAPLALGGGEPKIVHTTKVPILDDAGRPAYLLGIAEDVTERRLAEQQREALVAQLEEQNEQLLELDRMKDEFVALVSHELRTPLTSILGYLELALEEGELSADVQHFLDVAQRNSNRLLRLVSDLLFIAQVQAGKLNLDVGAVDLLRLVTECAETALPRAVEKSVVLTVDAGEAPAFRGDSTRLGQVLDNLVSNAIKFTPDGGTIQVRLRSDGSRAVIEVEDSGLGIPEAELPHLFERFYRTTTVTHLAIQGTGLGLPITMAIVEAHGGTIAVESVEGVGTTFRVELPLAEDPAAEAAA